MYKSLTFLCPLDTLEWILVTLLFLWRGIIVDIISHGSGETTNCTKMLLVLFKTGYLLQIKTYIKHFFLKKQCPTIGMIPVSWVRLQT